jgi:hypothetical protein
LVGLTALPAFADQSLINQGLSKIKNSWFGPSARPSLTSHNVPQAIAKGDSDPCLTTNQEEIMAQQQNNNQVPSWIYSTVKQFCQKYPAFTKGGLRFLIFHEHTNGLAKSGAIVRIGRKVLIDEAKFFAWIESQNQGGAL